MTSSWQYWKIQNVLTCVWKQDKQSSDWFYPCDIGYVSKGKTFHTWQRYSSNEARLYSAKDICEYYKMIPWLRNVHGSVNFVTEYNHMKMLFLDWYYTTLYFRYPFNIFFNLVNVRKWLCNKSLQWRHNGRDGVSNHQHIACLLNRLFRRR